MAVIGNPVHVLPTFSPARLARYVHVGTDWLTHLGRRSRRRTYTGHFDSPEQRIEHNRVMMDRTMATARGTRPF